MSRNTLLLLLSWLLANLAFLLLFFVPAYLSEAKSFGTLFPLGWDPPGYAGYAKIILSGDLLRPVIDQNSLGLANFLIAAVSLVTRTSTGLATIIFIHLTLAATSLFLAFLLRQYLSDTLVILASPWLCLFSAMALRLYTIPDQSLALALTSGFILLFVLQAEKEKPGREWYILSSAALMALYAAHWYYDLGVLTIAMLVLVLLTARELRTQTLRALAPPFLAAYVFSLTTIGLTLQKVLVEWKVSNIASPYSAPPTVATAAGYLNTYVFDGSVLVAALFIAGILELFFWGRPAVNPRVAAFRNVARSVTITACLVMGLGVALSNTSFVERGIFTGLLIVPVLVGAAWAREGASVLARRARPVPTGFLAVLLFILIVSATVATSVPYLQGYRQTYDVTYVTPAEFKLMQQGAAALSAGPYTGMPTVLLYNPVPSYYDSFADMKVATMVLGDVSFQYGLLPNSTLDPNLSPYEESLATYLNYLEYQELTRGGGSAGPFVLIGGLYNDPTGALALRSLNASTWAPLAATASPWALQTLPAGPGGAVSSLGVSNSSGCAGMPIRLQTTTSDSGERVSAFATLPGTNMSGMDYLRLTVNGNDSGDTWQLRLSTVRWTSFYYVTISDDFTGPREFVFAKSDFGIHGTPSWNRISSMEFIGQAQAGEWQFGCLEAAYNVSIPEVLVLPSGTG